MHDTVVHTTNLGVRGRQISEPGVSLVYVVSFRPAKTVQWDSVSNKQTNKEKFAFVIANIAVKPGFVKLTKYNFYFDIINRIV